MYCEWVRDKLQEFQSTLSSRRATEFGLIGMIPMQYFNPRSPHGERLFVRVCLGEQVSISIHALLTESDRPGCRSCVV